MYAFKKITLYPQKQEAKEVIKEICKEKNSKCIECNFNCVNIKECNIYSQKFDCVINHTLGAQVEMPP